MDLALLRTDFERWSTLHSWYKHISLSGETWWAYQRIGQEPRNGVCPQVEDISGTHWWFSCREPSGVKRYPFTVGPFLRGVEGRQWHQCRSDDCGYAYGIHIIVDDVGEERFLEWIREQYPQWSDCSALDWRMMDMKNPILKELYQSEQDKYYNELVKLVHKG